MRDHDHASCVAHVMAYAEAKGAEAGFRLTPVRRRVLEILLEEHRAIGAYEVLNRLHAEGMKSQPPVAYRALEFLETHGFVHKIERLNAFVACMHPGEEHSAAFMICRECRAVAETHSLPKLRELEETATKAGFLIESRFIELQGLCPDCRGNE